MFMSHVMCSTYTANRISNMKRIISILLYPMNSLHIFGFQKTIYFLQSETTSLSSTFSSAVGDKESFIQLLEINILLARDGVPDLSFYFVRSELIVIFPRTLSNHKHNRRSSALLPQILKESTGEKPLGCVCAIPRLPTRGRERGA